MSRRRILVVMAVALVTAACGRLGVGLPSCETTGRDTATANVLALQAVPSADYGPCINSLKLGWDEVQFEAESGMARIEIGREFNSFLEVTLTRSCDVSEATRVWSRWNEVERYEDITEVVPEIRVTIIPTGERPRIHAFTLAERLAEVRVEDRQIVFTVDEDIDFSVRSRVNRALFTDQFVWIISDLDIEEDTLELRRTPDGEGARGLSVEDALDMIEDLSPEVSYQGNWYLVFKGGCVTYTFDATGTVAETVEADADEAIGLFPLYLVREAGRRAGFRVPDE